MVNPEHIKPILGRVMTALKPFALKPDTRTRMSKWQPREWAEQRAVFEWAAWREKQYPALKLLHASMNGLVVSTPRIIVQAKLCGLKPGVPDIFWPVRRKIIQPIPTEDRISNWYCGLWVEQKRRKGGKLSSAQEWWRDALRQQGFMVEMAEGADETIDLICSYGGIPR